MVYAVGPPKRLMDVISHQEGLASGGSLHLSDRPGSAGLVAHSTSGAGSCVLVKVVLLARFNAMRAQGTSTNAGFMMVIIAIAPTLLSVFHLSARV